MCGIIGIISKNAVQNELLEKLKMLEYRGYDSSGISLFDSKIHTYKECGNIEKLEKALQKVNSLSTCGIGHTRWATHGKPSKINSHPHNDINNKISIVHNGIIENYLELKSHLESLGAKFISETDSEVIAHLLHYSQKLTNKDKMLELFSSLKGSFAILAIFENEPNTIYAINNHNPLIVGRGLEQKMVASDIIALVGQCEKSINLDNQLAIINTEVKVFNRCGVRIKAKWKKIALSPQDVSLNGADCYMRKEIYEIPFVMQKTLDYLKHNIDIGAMPTFLNGIKSLHFIGCGTALHSGCIAKQWCQQFHIQAQAHYASEFRYFTPPLDKSDLCVFISQSGETTDTLEALKIAKNKGLKCVAITNNLNSSIVKLAKNIIPVYAGIEISVASTKAYNGQLISLIYLINSLLEKKDKINIDNILVDAISKIDIQKFENNIYKISQLISRKEHIFFIGKGADYYTALEASLKLKEISYIHCEGFPAGELKHGTIALIDNSSIVIAIATDETIFEKTLNALHEVKSRGATTILISPFNSTIADYIIPIPKVNKILLPIISVIPCQILALQVAQIKKLNPDKPRNLAKSVTVE